MSNIIIHIDDVDSFGIKTEDLYPLRAKMHLTFQTAVYVGMLGEFKIYASSVVKRGEMIMTK